MKLILVVLSTLLAVLLMVASPATAQPRPLKVFILAGQSNMEGHAKVETFDYIGDDPATAPLLKQMRGPDGQPRVCEGAWISYYTGAGDANGEGHGKLTAGYGSRRQPNQDGGKIGPEFTFGITMDAAFDEPVLIIKTAWGGKSLHTDFRPPSAGPYVFNESQLAQFKKQGKDIDAVMVAKENETGCYYRLMLEHVRHVLSDIKRVCPAYDEQQGFEIAGFVWFQGWNDLVDSETYPNRSKPGGYDAYSETMAHFIRDVRRDLKAPRMPFVVGVLGVGGAKPNEQTIEFRKAMSAPAALPEFRGNVIAVPTAPFWSEDLGAIADKHDKVRQMNYYLDSKHKDHANADGSMTAEQKREYVKNFEAKLISPAEAALWKRGASNAGYHYLGCAKTFAVMGRAFAEATLTMLNSPMMRADAKPVEEQAADRTRSTAVSIANDRFLINGHPTYKGRTWNGTSIEGLLMNSRMVQATFDDRNPETVGRWAYPDTKTWDADRNTTEFVEMIPTWRKHGLLAVTLNLQGGSPEGYSKMQPWHNSAINSDGTLDEKYMARLAKVIDKADEAGMVVILGLYYFGQDQRVKDEAAVSAGVDAAVDWLIAGKYSNVLVEVNNECNVSAYDHDILKPDRVHELIERVRIRSTGQKHALLVGTSYGGGSIPRENVVRASDFLLLHGNGVKQPARIREMVQQTRAVPGYRAMPVLFNEDDHFNFDQPENNFTAAVSERASWGYFDFRMKDEGFDEGFQSVPVNWSLSSDRKRGFFRLLSEITE